MPTPAEDRQYLERALPELKTYLLTDILFYPLGSSLPRLTLGGLLIAQRRLSAYEDASPLDLRLDTLRTKWRSAWEKKAAQEAETRLTLWKNYLDEYRHNQELSDYYTHEVGLRVMLELLIAELERAPAELAVIDQRLRATFTGGAFIWDDVLTKVFSRDDFWFLYGALK